MEMEMEMEALRRLERVQRALAFLHSHGLSSPSFSSAADRFLAHLLLLLVQPSPSPSPSPMLSLETKCSLALHFLNNVTPQVLEELRCFEIDEIHQGKADEYSGTPSKAMNNKEIELKGPAFLDMPLIALESMQRANSTLEDFLDTWNEKNLCKVSDNIASVQSACQNVKIEENSMLLPKFFGSDSFDPLIRLLGDQGLISDRIINELESGLQYWALETNLCQALAKKEKILIEDVLQASHLKSFDYRVLNLLLYQLRGQEVNELHMEFLSVSEFLVEVSDDLYDYEDDVANNTFNILRMFIAVYGASLAPKMLIKCITDAEKRYEDLSKKLDPNLSLNYCKRCREATKEGGLNDSMNDYGKWSIPPLILDEDAFRAQNIRLSMTRTEPFHA